MNGNGFFNPFGSSGSGGGGGKITVDTQVMGGSTNPVQNGAIYDFVNSSVATNTANFIGTFDSFSDLSAYSGTITNNDYAFVVNDYALLDEQPTDWATNYTSYFTKSTVAPTWVANKYYSKQDSTYTLTTSQPSSWSTNYANYYTKYNQNQYRSVVGLDIYSSVTGGSAPTFAANTYYVGSTISYNRYKYTTETNEWLFEYTLNNSSFTAAEWETIQSGLTANDRTNYNNHLTNTNNPHSVTKTQVGLGNVDNTSDANKPISTATQTALNGKQDNLTFDGTYDASTNKAATVSTVTNAINDLDVSSVGGSGKYISAISETNGKISPTVETMDTVPTSGSTKAVTSGGVQAPLAEVVDNGTKNLFDMSGAQTFDVTGYGVHCTIDKLTGAITLDGVNQDKKCTGNFNIKIADSTALGLQSGVVYKLTCDGYTTSDTTIGIYVYTSGATPETQFDTYNNTELAWNTAWEQSNGFQLFIRSGTVVNNITLRPMLCTKAVWDISHEYVPYGRTNAELTVENDSQQSEIDYAVNTGVKNLLNLSGITPTVPSGLTLTDNNDGTFSVSGTLASANSITFLIDPISGNLILSGCPSGGGDSSYMVRLTKNGTAVSESTDTGGGSQIFSMDGTGYALAFRFAAGTYTNVVFKPMIRHASITDSTFVPYALPNPVLTPEIIELVDSGAKNKFTYGDLIGITTNFSDQPFSLPAGSYKLIFTASASTGAFAVRLKNSQNNSIYYITADNAATAKTYDLNISEDAAKITFYSSVSNDFTNIMICTKAAWDVSHAYEPYALPNSTLTPAAIKAVDDGAKNLSPVASGGNGAQNFFQSDVFDFPAGNYILYLGNITTDATGDVNQVAFYGADSQNVGESQYYYISRGNGVYIPFVVTAACKYVRIYAGSNNSGSIGKTMTFTNMMICTAADWNVSQEFVPYCPTNRKLYTGEFQSSMTSLTDNLNTTFIDKANSRLNVYKYGKICFADISLKTNASALTGSDAITATALPSELRPTSTFYAMLLARDAGGWALANFAPASFSIDTNGVATLRTGAAHSSAEYIIGYISWLAAI